MKSDGLGRVNMHDTVAIYYIGRKKTITTCVLYTVYNCIETKEEKADHHIHDHERIQIRSMYSYLP